ncbi:FAD-binding domain-containing protein [Lojkania enalia]|uniref:FAD-binding domain-containing protein n=1 Tax=Lojkania enalia TaxID=147567 RepID=A0A9P4K7Q7_9PLEO|nr:FAD-binding domain-containing protein [Didymosphaeria enalia]
MPAALFQPTSKEDVAKFMQLVKPFIQDGKFAFAIRGGGQNPLPYCANIEKPGITLDLTLLNGINVKDGCITIGGGARWGAVFDALDGTGFGVSGNRSSRAGIRGLALQGGLSFFSSREGFVSDNILNYEIVLASGEIVNANANENFDLWLALRGGSNNFGIGGSVYYFGPSFPGQIDALVAELQKEDATEETHLMISTGFAAMFGPQPMCQNQVYYTKEVEKPAVLEPFVSITPQIDSMSSMRMLSKCSYMNVTVKADAATLKTASEFYSSAVGAINTTDGLICSFTLQPYALSCLKKSVSQGGNSLGLDPKDGPLVSVLLLTYWDKKEDDDKIAKTMRGVLEDIRKDSKEKGTAVPFESLNYAYQFQDPIGSYGEDNKKKLQEVSKKHDLEGIFQTAVPGGFKLFV